LEDRIGIDMLVVYQDSALRASIWRIIFGFVSQY
jgi:hypothetical protein